MLIVYISLGLAVVALIYLGVSALQTFKAWQPILKSISTTAAHFQKKMEDVKKENDQLKSHMKTFQKNIHAKKKTVKNVITVAQSSLKGVQSIWGLAVTPPNPKRFAHTEPDHKIGKIGDDLLGLWEKVKNLRR